MRPGWSLTEEAFNNLLDWLDKDRDRAGEKYERIRGELIRVFARRGCPIAEELTDETINRVTRKALEVAQDYVGDPSLYFYGVAKNVFKEYSKKQGAILPMPPPDPPEEKERRLACLDKCMDELDAESRDLILDYFRDEKRAKIERRKQLARRLGVTLNTLRMRAHRVKLTLQQCVSDCLRQKQFS